MLDAETTPTERTNAHTSGGESRREALLALARAVRATGYRFTTVTPASHAHVNARPENARARSLRDVLGWSRPFEADLLPADLTDLMDRAGILGRDPATGLLRAGLRLSSLDDDLFFHAGFPPLAADAVFFGPDTVRYVRAVQAHLDALEREGRSMPKRAVDIGCGSGAAGIVVAKRLPEAEVVLVDINPAALDLAGVNARLAGVTNTRPALSDMLAGVEGGFDLITSNPPFMVDRGGRAYRDGGGTLGAGLPLRVVEAAAERLNPGGSLVLFTGSAIVEGRDGFFEEATVLCGRAGLDWTYQEYDPDAYGEELAGPVYAEVERLALSVLTATRRA